MRETETETSWHLDKKVPLAMLFAIVLQTGTAFWWASGVSARVDQLSEANSVQNTQIMAVQMAGQAQAVSGATLAAQIDSVRSLLGQMQQDQRAMNELLRQLLRGTP